MLDFVGVNVGLSNNFQQQPPYEICSKLGKCWIYFQPTQNLPNTSLCVETQNFRNLRTETQVQRITNYVILCL